MPGFFVRSTPLARIDDIETGINHARFIVNITKKNPGILAGYTEF